MRSHRVNFLRLLPMLLALAALWTPGFRIDSGASWTKERSISCLQLPELLLAASYATSKDLVSLPSQKPILPSAYFGGTFLVNHVDQRDGTHRLGYIAGALLPRTTLVGVVVLRI